MACGNLTGVTYDLCQTSIGGVKNIYLINHADVTAVNVGEVSGITGEMITGVTLSGDSKFLKYSVKKNTCSFSSELQVNDNGSYWVTTLNIVLPRMEASKHAAITSLVLAEAAAIVEDKNGAFWYIGKDNPLTLASGTAETGTARDDSNAYTIGLEDESLQPPYEIDPKIVNGLIEVA